MISATVLITVGIQVYRNVQNYKMNKQSFVNDVQQALDLSVEAYFANLAREDIFIMTAGNRVASVSLPDSLLLTEFLDDSTHDHEPSFFADDIFRSRALADSIKSRPSLSFTTGLTLFDQTEVPVTMRGTKIKSIGFSTAWPTDSFPDMEDFVRRITISLAQNRVNFAKLDSFLINELERKKIKIDHALYHEIEDTVFTSNDKKYALSTVSKSTYLPGDEELSVKFNNASLIVLKRGMLDLLISLIISGAVIGSLLYLYRIITEQKQLAEIKNDLISNITHEFKTPIATVSTAIEAISNFNQANDPVKTAKYLDISSNQLQKLNGMVEKLLETASLDSDELDLSLEGVEVVEFTQQIFDKFHLIKGEKKLIFQTELSEKMKEIDPFHMENAVSNLLDNAIKYGGNEISIRLSESEDKVLWQVLDNGGKIDKQHQQRIFDQFYRVPTGNVHDVKGFGIGLYYTKKIVEKHGGEISLSVSSNKTEFTIEV